MLLHEQLFSVGSHPCVFRLCVFRKGQTLLLCYIFSFQVHNLPSCPVLKNFQQTVERRSVDSLLFLLEDGSRWLPVSMPPALGVVLGLPRVDELHQLTAAGRSPFWSAAFLHQRLLLPHEVCALAITVQCLESGTWARKKESTLRRPRCGLTSCFADSHGES